MKTKIKPFRSNQKQRDDLATIKKRLGELGYGIYTPIKRLRRNPHDFLATLGELGYLYRIGRKGIEVRPYRIKSFFFPILPFTLKRKSLKTRLKIVRALPSFEGSWKLLIIPSEHKWFDEKGKT